MTTTNPPDRESDDVIGRDGGATSASALFADLGRAKVLYGTYREAIQDQQFEEVLGRLEAHHRILVEYTTPRRSNYGPPLSEDDSKTVPASLAEGRVVEISVVVRKSSEIMALIFLASLASWLFARVPLINPFVSILGLFSCPFFFAMANRIGSKAEMKSPNG